MGSRVEPPGSGDQWADGIHAFTESPVPAYRELAAEDGIRFLSYTDEELDEILDGHPEYSKIKVPAGTYENQDDEVGTFCEKVLVCVSADMDEDLVHEIAWALEVNGPVYTAGEPFMRAMDDREFRLLRSRFRFMTERNGIMSGRDISNSKIFRNCSVAMSLS